MLDTYIKNRGVSKTIIHNNNHNESSEVNWDADYDGDSANISLDMKDNGLSKHYDIKLTNEDLASILNVPSVDTPLNKRLLNDFNRAECSEPDIYKIEFENLEPNVIPFTKKSYDTMSLREPELIEYIKPPHKKYTHISSPLQNEEFIIPVKIDNKTMDNYKFTPKRRHKRIRTHKTYQVYKKPKSAKFHKTSRNSKKYTRKSKYGTL
jgi:hypothetical protein